MAGTQQIRPPQFAANSVEQLWRPEVGCTTQPKKPFGQPDDGLNSRGRHHCVTEPPYQTGAAIQTVGVIDLPG
jgi:hypothetical protein